jgi:hypothetical protein
LLDLLHECTRWNEDVSLAPQETRYGRTESSFTHTGRRDNGKTLTLEDASCPKPLKRPRRISDTTAEEFDEALLFFQKLTNICIELLFLQ